MKSTVSIVSLFAAFALSLAMTTGCSTVPEKESDRERLASDVETTLDNLTIEDPSLKGLLDNSAGYAIFPSVGKGGFGVAGAYGRGHVFEGNRWVGYSDVTQGTVGVQAGGQTFHEVVVLQDRAALERFKTGQYALAANASAVALKAGAGKAAKFNDGVAVFVKPEGGLMFEAAIGGRKFSFVPVSASEKVDND